jgi:hypothetical protein
MSAYWAANWPIWISAFCVIAVYTYLFKDNALYRVMMQIFIGVNLGYQAIIQWRDVLYPQWWLPMIDGFRAIMSGKGSPWGALWSLVGVIGVLFYLQLSRKYAPLSKIAIGITIGIGAGITFKSQIGQNIPQVLDSFKPLAPSIVRPQPRTVVRLPGSIYPPTVDGSLAFFVSANRVSADELLGGVEIWSANLPRAITGSVEVAANEIQAPCGGETIRIDRSTGAILGKFLSAHSVALPSPKPTPTVAMYRQPQFAHAVELTPNGTEIEARSLRDGAAEGIQAGDSVWNAKFSETIVSVQSFDGVALVTGAHTSEIWEIPTPQPKLTAGDYFDNWVSVITVVSVMSYFFFSFRRRGKITLAVSNTGRWLLMIGFGAFFGNTVMTRMSFLLDRLMFLIDDWLRPFFHQFLR